MQRKFSEEDRQRILAESRAHIERVDAMLADPRPDNESAGRPFCTSPVIETRNARHIREIAERDEKWERERRREQASLDALEARIERRLQAEIESLRKEMIDVVQMTGTAVETISTEIDRLHDIVRTPMVAADAHVKQTLERIEQLVGDLGGRGGCVVDLPNPIARRVN
jgi:hypothetical protein